MNCHELNQRSFHAHQDQPWIFRHEGTCETIRETNKKGNRNKDELGISTPTGETGIPDEDRIWRTKLHRILTKQIAPASFERLIQRILQEYGFVQAELTGRIGDGGIDSIVSHASMDS